jgi:hypothetical protein
MNTNLKSKDAFDLLQLANKLEHSITPDNESLDQKWYSLIQLHGGVQACVELLRPRKFYIKELMSFMETIRSISCSIPENNDNQHFVDNPADLPCTSTQNVQNTDIAISVCNKCAEKPQDDIEKPLQFKKIRIKPVKSANDQPQTNTLICRDKIPVVKASTLTKKLISSKYKSLLNSDTWGNDVLPEFKNTSQTIGSSSRDIYDMDIQTDNILEHSFFMTNGCNWFGPSGICDQLKFYPNQIKLLSLSVKNKSDKLKHLVNTKIFCGSLPDEFHTDFIEIYNAASKTYMENFRNNNTWLQTNKHSNLSLRNRHLISPNVGDWYDHILTTKSWDYREFWTCRMWVVWIFVFVLHKLISKLVSYERKTIQSS